MPLYDHFRPPISKRASWEGFHGFWPGKMVEALFPHLPPGFTAEPRVHLGNLFELDVNTYHREEWDEQGWSPDTGADGTAVATAAYTLPRPALVLDDADFDAEYAYEVLVFDRDRDRTLVAAVEIVSPANKDRPTSRAGFVAKCAALLSRGVCVSIVDVVTVKRFNLYADLLDTIGRSDPSFLPTPPATYAVTLRTSNGGKRTSVETWSYALEVGSPLPTLPIWLDDERMIPLDLESSYSETCRYLQIP